MAHPFDPSRIGQDIVEKLNEILNDDIKKHVDFAERQAILLAKQGAWIAEATIQGELDDKDRNWFIDHLKSMTENLARTIVGLTILTIEKTWNAIVGVLWGAINGALKANGIPLTFPVPGAPAN